MLFALYYHFKRTFACASMHTLDHEPRRLILWVMNLLHVISISLSHSLLNGHVFFCCFCCCSFLVQVRSRRMLLVFRSFSLGLPLIISHSAHKIDTIKIVPICVSIRRVHVHFQQTRTL